MLPVIHSIAIGPLVITPHGLFFALGAVAAAAFLLKKRKALGLSAGTIVERVFWIFALGLLGARLAYLLAYPDEWQEVAQVLTIWEGGLVSFGGLLVGSGMVFWFAKKTAERDAWLSSTARAFLLGWAIGRIGNFFALESAGVVSPTWDFLHGTVPIQLFESLGCLMLFFGLRSLSTLRLTYGALGGYLLIRFVIDFWRDESVFSGLRVSQWVSAGLFIALVFTYWRLHAQGRKEGRVA
jgi:prolipoprotein diacylglyceryltransferase